MIYGPGPPTHSPPIPQSISRCWPVSVIPEGTSGDGSEISHLVSSLASILTGGAPAAQFPSWTERKGC